MKHINKLEARKLYGMGKEFWMVACNMRPECGLLVNAPGYESSCHHVSMKFDDLYNCFCYYNCDNERGRYPRFYIDDNKGEQPLLSFY